MKDNTQCYAISIAEDLIIESRDYMEDSDDIRYIVLFNIQ